MKDPIFKRMFDYDRSLLPNKHLAALEQGVGSIEQARSRTGASIGYPGWGLIYHLLLCHLDRDRFETLIETGTNHGATSIILAQALIDSGCQGEILTFELEQSIVDIASQNFIAADVSDRIRIFVGDTKTTLAPVVSGLNDCRFAVVDASHLHDDAVYEFEVLANCLSPDALVVFDNTYRIADEGEDARVNGALQTILSKHGGNLINLEHVSWFTPGLAIWQKQPAL